MSFFKTLGFFAEAKTENLGNDLVGALARFDPEGMSEAGMKEMENQVDTLALETAKLRQEFTKEQTEADEINALMNKRLAAAGILQDKLESGDTAVESSLMSLLDQIEKMTSEVDREGREATEAKSLYESYRQETEEMAAQVKNARSEFDELIRFAKSNKIAEDRANRNEDRAKRMSGIKSGGSGLSSAMDAMKKANQESQARTEAATMKADLLAPTSLEQDDPVLAAALAEASGESTTPLSASDRLAALRNR